MRGYEGLDLFLRAKDALNIGYYKQPVFFYTQRNGSMSKSNVKIRAKIRKDILARVGL